MERALPSHQHVGHLLRVAIQRDLTCVTFLAGLCLVIPQQGFTKQLNGPNRSQLLEGPSSPQLFTARRGFPGPSFSTPTCTDPPQSRAGAASGRHSGEQRDRPSPRHGQATSGGASPPESRRGLAGRYRPPPLPARPGSNGARPPTRDHRTVTGSSFYRPGRHGAVALRAWPPLAPEGGEGRGEERREEERAALTPPLPRSYWLGSAHPTPLHLAPRVGGRYGRHRRYAHLLRQGALRGLPSLPTRCRCHVSGRGGRGPRAAAGACGQRPRRSLPFSSRPCPFPVRSRPGPARPALAPQ